MDVLQSPEAERALQPGRIAKVRQRAYLVEQVVPPSRAGEQTLVRLACVDDDAQGQALEVLWESEIDAQMLSGEAWDAVASRGFDDSQLFGAYINTLRWNCVTSTDPRLFQSPFRAGIRIDAYQVEPLRKALLLPRVNLFIADDVGLGKTIEAGLIARELLLRKKVREIVVCCPPSMLLQWQEELEQRFGLGFEILDKEYVSRVRRERGFGVNPWSTHSRFLISHRLLIDETYTGPLRDWLGEFRGNSLLILDEAHHAAPSSGQRYAIDSQITRAVRELAPRFEHRLFLSATPHNGHSNSFSALLEILDPQRFCRGVPARKKQLDDVMVRRIKDDVREVIGGFPKREVVQVDIDGLPPDAPELKLAALLDQYRRLREQRLQGETRRQQAAAGLLITGLQQRLFSSIEAFARTLRVHRRTVQRQWEAAQAGQAPEDQPVVAFDLLRSSVGSDDDRAALSEAELRQEEEAQFEAASAAAEQIGDSASAKTFADEQKLLDQMTEVAEGVRGEPDARIKKLIEWIEQKMCPGLRRRDGGPTPHWNDARVIIFTEYDDTKRYLQGQLATAIAHTDRADERIAIFHGPTPQDEREKIKRAFNADPAKHPIRVLIATDAAREGLNLQAHCCNLFHFDVPWNPTRMEQRNGRIDRKLQPAKVVYCHYFFYKQRPEDRILQALVRKTKTIRSELGSLAQVIDSRLDKLMGSGIRREQIEQMEREINSADLEAEQKQIVQEELEAARQRQDRLRDEISELQRGIDRSQRAIGFDQDHFKSAISASLKMLNAPPLEKLPGDKPAYRFPPLDQRDGADATWAATMDTLRAPRSSDQGFYEWRRQSPVRPIVFEDPGTMDEETVHLHLEQRVVQRLLSRFTAQGFLLRDLSRACLTQTSDGVARVILLGRLCLYGPGAARLHEELIPITARWTAPNIRKEKLVPYGRDSEGRTMDLLDEALRKQTGQPTDRSAVGLLQTAAPQDIDELLPHLQNRGEEYAKDAMAALTKRGEVEANAMREILELQKKRIAEAANKYTVDDEQLRLQFPKDDERRQVESNRRHWGKRLATIDQELVVEPQRIRGLYEVKAKRIEPVGLVYLWPAPQR
jgi:superfamily II DNA or RNA helicase